MDIDKIYITGGFNGQECMNSGEVYDPETNQWTNLTAMRSRRSGVSCIAYHNKVKMDLHNYSIQSKTGTGTATAETGYN